MHDFNEADSHVPLSDRKTIDLSVTQSPASRWSWVIDRNPMFLLSGVFMLAGCFLVSRHIHEMDPSEVGTGVVIGLLITLLFVLNVYEFAVIGLGLALAKTRTLVRDSRHLLGLALLLLIDSAFVYTELSTVDPRIGLAIAGVATALACFKAWWVVRSLDLWPSLSASAVSAVALGAMYAMPIVVRGMASDGFLQRPQAMAVWAGLGLAIALYALPTRWARLGVSISADHAQLQRLVRGGLILLPLVSLVGHAAAALWVYESAFEPAMASPVLLGLAAIVLRHPKTMGGGRASAQVATLTVGCAIVTSLLPSDALVYVSERSSLLSVSPLRCVLLVSPLLLGWAWWVGGRRPLGLVNIVLPMLAASLGHSPMAMLRHLRSASAWAYTLASSHMPTTKLQWGAIAIAAAFGCLLLGTILSWLGRWREGDHTHGRGLMPEPAPEARQGSISKTV